MALSLLLNNNTNTDFNSQNNISIVLEDLFIRFGKYINETYGFKEFTDYYLNTRKFQRDLSIELHLYYDAVDENNQKEQVKQITKIICITDIYRSTFIHLVNENFMGEFENYFRKKKKNISEISHYENNDLIISRLHSEWILRSKQIEAYYDYLVEENTKSLSTENRSILDRFIEYIKPNEKKEITSIEIY